MKKNAAGEGKIFFLNFTYNPALRTLQQDECVQQLRKKQSDVLALLCTKFPEPVSQEDFLKEVWNDGYVTSQSIAQVIRSLRLCLNDESKEIIVTIPKLGYQLVAQPVWEADESVLVNSALANAGSESTCLTSQQPVRRFLSESIPRAITPRGIANERANRELTKPRKSFFSTVATFCLNLFKLV